MEPNLLSLTPILPLSLLFRHHTYLLLSITTPNILLSKHLLTQLPFASTPLTDALSYSISLILHPTHPHALTREFLLFTEGYSKRVIIHFLLSHFWKIFILALFSCFDCQSAGKWEICLSIRVSKWMVKKGECQIYFPITKIHFKRAVASPRCILICLRSEF